MEKTMRGRPRLNLDLEQILEAVRRNRQVVAAARELGCSDAYIHKVASLQYWVSPFQRCGAKVW